MCHRIVPITLEEAQDLAEQMARGGRAFARPDDQGRWRKPPADAYPGSAIPVIVSARGLAFVEMRGRAQTKAPGGTASPGCSPAPVGEPAPEEAPPVSQPEREAQLPDPMLQAVVLSWGFWGQKAPARADIRRAAAHGEDARPDDQVARQLGTRPQGAKLVFNTRLDTALRQLSDGRGMWAEAMASGRCLVPVRAFFERGGRDVRFTMPGAGAFLLAGVAQGGQLSVVTTDANAAVSPVHARMPLVLGRGESAVWLRGCPEQLAALGDRSGIRLASDQPAEARPPIDQPDEARPSGS